MTKDEKSLLLYFESCLVNNRGQVQSVRMNIMDFGIAEKLDHEKLIKFDRIPFKEIEKQNSLPARTHWVQFTDKAWEIVHKLRRQRAERHVPTIIN